MMITLTLYCKTTHLTDMEIVFVDSQCCVEPKSLERERERERENIRKTLCCVKTKVQEGNCLWRNRKKNMLR